MSTRRKVTILPLLFGLVPSESIKGKIEFSVSFLPFTITLSLVEFNIERKGKERKEMKSVNAK